MILHVYIHINCASIYIIVCVQSLSHAQLFTTSWTVTCQALLSTDFSRQEHWSGLPFPSPGIYICIYNYIYLIYCNIYFMYDWIFNVYTYYGTYIWLDNVHVHRYFYICSYMSACSVTSVVSDSATLWTVAYLPGSSSRQECWSGLPFPPPGDLPDPGIKPWSPASSVSQADSLPLDHQVSPCLYTCIYIYIYDWSRNQHCHTIFLL